MSESQIFKAAVKLSSERRAAYLDQACGANQVLRRDVESLLRAHEDPGSFLQSHLAPPLATVEAGPIAEQPGTRIGPYKLLQQIGEGGMGVVYMAEQQEPVRRKVALKIIKPGMDSKQVIARFEAERQALALMDHQNIAKVLDASATESGRPYFVMELVHGVPLTKYCDDHHLTPRQRLELFLPTCHAVQHAHQKGIIHRDLKPSNILVTMYDDKPVPKVIDFGVAKAVEQRLTEKTLFTQFGTMVGTFEYMSPEQAEMNAFGVDTRSDVYSMGVVLYELLTGTTPLERQQLREAAYGEIVRLIKEEEPPKPSTRLSTSGAALARISQQRGSEPDKLTKLVRGELDWIVMRCLEKDRTRRYETANALARDVERYLKDEPVEACPPTAGYKLRKFARKNQELLVTAAAFAALLLLGVAASSWQAVRATGAEALAHANAIQAKEKERDANQRRDEAERQRDEIKTLNDKLLETQARLQGTLYASRMNLAQYAWEAGDIERVRALLELQRPTMGETDLRNFEWGYLYRLCHAELLTLKHTGTLSSVAYSPDGKRLATVSGKNPSQAEVKVWDAQTGKELFSIKGAGIGCVAFSRPDGKRLATPWRQREVKEWDAETGKELRAFQVDPNQGGFMYCLAYSRDGKRLAAGHGGLRSEVSVWDTKSEKELFTLKGHTAELWSVAFTSDGKRLATASGDKTVKVWDAANGKELLTLKGHTDWVSSVAFSPDGRQLATASYDETVKVWDAETGKELRSLQGPTDAGWSILYHRAKVGCVAYSPDGKRLASASAYGTVRLWDALTGKPLFAIRGHSRSIVSVVFRPDGKQLASASFDTTVKVWDAETGQGPLTVKVGGFSTSGAVVSPDGKRVASAGATLEPGKRRPVASEVKVWDIRKGKELITLKEGHTQIIYALAFSPDGKRLATASGEETVKVWDLKTSKEHMSLEGGGSNSVAFSPDGKRLASTGLFNGPGKFELIGKGKVWDAQTGKELFSFEGGGNCVIFSPDGKRLAAASNSFAGGPNGEIKLFDAQTGKEIRSFKGGGGSVAFSPDGKRLASAGGDVRVWDVETGKELLTLKEYTYRMWRVAFSPDGKRLASASPGAGVKVWDAQSGQELLSFRGQNESFNSVAFSPDGRRLVSGADDGTVKIWDATPLPEKP